MIRGVVKCQWAETENYGNSTRTVCYKGKDVLLDDKVTFFPGGKILVGIHRYDFECTLPLDIPGSYQTFLGIIEYKVQVKVDIPWAIDKNKEKRFTVVRVEDLNLNFMAFIPIKIETTKALCSILNCSRKPCILTLSIPHCGYVPGQDLPFQIEFRNKSDVSISYTNAALNRNTTYLSDTPFIKAKVKSEFIARVHIRRMNKNKDIYTYEGTLRIPSNLHPSNVHCSRKLKVSYELVIEVVLVGCHSNVKIETAIIIGSIPITNADDLLAEYLRSKRGESASAPTAEEIEDHNSSKPGRYNGTFFFLCLSNFMKCILSYFVFHRICESNI